MDDQESSSGLMIGMIIGGAVVLVLLAGVGVMLFMPSRMDERPAAPGPILAPPPDIVVEKSATPDPRPENGPVITSKPEPMSEIVNSAPAKAPVADDQFAKARKRLVGSWEGVTADGARFVLHFRADGKLDMDAFRAPKFKPGGTQTVSKWAVVGDDDKVIKIRNDSFFNESPPGLVHELMFEKDNQFTVRSPRLPGDVIGRLAGGGLDGLVFTRREAAGSKK